MNRYARWAAIYLALMGLAPLAWPEHDTWSNPVTWLDWALHLAGAAYLVVDLRRRYGHRTIGDLITPPRRRHPSMQNVTQPVPPTEYRATLMLATGVAVNPKPLRVQTAYRYGHLCRRTDGLFGPEHLVVFLNDDPDGPIGDDDYHVVASFDRVGSAIWVDGYADVLYEERKP